MNAIQLALILSKFLDYQTIHNKLRFPTAYPHDCTGSHTAPHHKAQVRMASSTVFEPIAIARKGLRSKQRSVLFNDDLRLCRDWSSRVLQGETAPMGFSLCDGEPIARALYATCFFVLGATMSSDNRELVFGLIAPIGVDRAPVITAICNELSKVRYDVEEIRVSSQIEKFAGPYAKHDYVKRKNALMDAGNKMRKWHKFGDAAALLSMLEIGKSRRRRGVAKTILTPHAYIVDSLKHPDEIERFQSVYGSAFIGIALYEPPDIRRKRVTDAATTLLSQPDREAIANLMQRDEDEGLEYGQKVREAFELADFVLDLTRSQEKTESQLWRLIRCLFGDVQVTPTVDEFGMSLAHTAQAKSSSLARQVGAAVVRSDHSVAAVACNDVAKPGGGQYVEEDDINYPQGRDVNWDTDSSDYFRHRAMTDFIARLQSAGELAGKNRRVAPDELFRRWWNSQDDPWLRRSFQNGTIDYIRAVHAEMAAITDCARSGVDLAEATLYTTTFPCHDCAKHIVATGLKEVVYLAPYPKSLVEQLYDDSIEVNASAPSKNKVQFHSFVGVAPKRYSEFFIFGKRERKKNGKPIRFKPSDAKLTLPANAPEPKSVIVSENDLTNAFALKLKSRLKKESGRARTDTKSRRRPK